MFWFEWVSVVTLDIGLNSELIDRDGNGDVVGDGASAL